MLKQIPMWFLALAFSGQAFAQRSYSPEHRDWEVTAFGGGSFVNDHEFPTPVVGVGQQQSETVGVHYAAGYQVGLRIGENLGDYWGADLEYSFANQPLTFTNLSPAIQSFSAGQAIHHFSYNVSYLPFTPRSRFRPYGSIGAGAALYYISKASKIEASSLGLSLRSDWQFAANFGGGFKYLIEDEVAVTFDVRDQMSKFPSYGLPQSTQVIAGRYQPGLARTGLLHNWQLNIGFTFQWDD
jgi:outer membrane protein W